MGHQAQALSTGTKYMHKALSTKTHDLVKSVNYHLSSHMCQHGTGSNLGTCVAF